LDAVRVLGIETTSRRGTVALLDGGAVVSIRVHDAKAVHGEVMLPFIGELFDEAGWSRTSLDRIGVGTGPGSFTGIRVGLALAKGMALGLGRPVLGIGSLRAMCRGVPDGLLGTRWAVLDGRREDLFLGGFGPDGEVVGEPRIMPRGATEWLESLASSRGVLVGEVDLLGPLDSRIRVHRSELTDLPHAIGTALAAGEMEEGAAPAEPAYLRPVDAIRPPAVRSPLSSKQPR
jgi:tRNA threonylcarbamoyladenosine biosynthesis protein TsaB